MMIAGHNGKIQATFVMEQHVGHHTYYQNLRRFIDLAPLIDATWIEVTYGESTNLWDRLPGLPASVRGTMIGRSQVRRGLRQQSSDVTVFNTQVPAALGGGSVRQPYILCTDIMPIQYDEMGAEYGHEPDRSGLISLYKHRFNTGLFGHAARILPWSTWTRESLIWDYGVDAGRIEVLPPGVDTEVWLPGERRQPDHPRILFVGGDFVRKGGDLLLEAFHQLDPGTADLFLVTHTPLIPDNGITVYDNLKPNSAELIELYQSCDIFVLPTKAEVDFHWHYNQGYGLRLQAEGTELRAWIDGKLLLTVQDEERPLTGGAAAFVVEQGHIMSQSMLVQPLRQS